MKAFIYDVKRYYRDSDNNDEKEFIVASNSLPARDKEARRIYAWYVKQAKQGLVNSDLGDPLAVENELYQEDARKAINWRDLMARQLEQNKTRPRGIGCIFRGGSPESKGELTNEDMLDLRASIEYFMQEHRNGQASYLFIGSKWRLQDRSRYGKIAVFEACGIEFAADMAQLEFLSPKGETVLTDWCCPIYVA